jgi:hypothetical protein
MKSSHLLDPRKSQPVHESVSENSLWSGKGIARVTEDIDHLDDTISNSNKSKAKQLDKL